MENWKIQLVVMTFCVLVQTSQGSSSSTEEERRLSRHWQHQSVESAMTIPVESLMKRSKALRFYGLMGKREVTKKSFQPKKRNKGETFAGLMGRSVTNEESLSGVIPSATTREIHDPEKPYKQASLKEWIRILY
ncbi:uncharacterized protein LOC118564397 isoform X1 [Fundulus heteroclitus]|uniref:uncharacterized protein LOC118564397 isoform X1 n=1 Tax=Fundulus heteroclitus TaxID=8078 RepID=UPI00165CB6A2|nr:uncharacterized protein LOC118564397 isoform X1 [Fundulus heteroclitus]